MPPAVSVLMPCYNAAATLDQALDSLAAQTLADFEIVAVDDGSTDDTPVLLQRRAAADPRLRVIYTEHGGLVAALNAGLRACQAPVVARLDADDRCHPERLARQAAWLEAHPETDVVACRVAGFPAGDVRQGFQVYLDWQNSLLTNAEIRREIFVESPLAHPSVAFRRERVLALGGYQDHGWPEDYDLWLRLYLAGAGFARLPETLVEWREHPARLTRCDPRYSLENFLRLKAYYLMRGPLAGRDVVILWGAGMAGRRLSKHLLRQEAPLAAFIDIDPKKIGNLRRQRPILPPEALPGLLQGAACPALLVTVGSRGARAILRRRLNALGLVEGRDWWCAA
jgi:glycosyltransferase involved in cell wall biosynthesis